MIAMRRGAFVSLTIVFASACSSNRCRHQRQRRRQQPSLGSATGVWRRRTRATTCDRRIAISANQWRFDFARADGRVTCSRRADARVRVSRERLTKTFSLLCRPILAVGVKPIWVLAGGDSAALDPHAIGLDGEHERLIAGVAMVHRYFDRLCRPRNGVRPTCGRNEHRH